MKPLLIHPRAAKDARDIASMYAEISDELRDQFWNEIDDAIDHIERYPKRHHFDPSGRRRSIVQASGIRSLISSP